jgi:signal transduction histidine kinase/CheY-like chemotaxis protein
MRGSKIIYYILGAFIAGTFLLIFIQFNSSKSIDSLISGNEKLVNEFNVSGELKELEKDVITVESKVRGTVNTSDTSYIEGLDENILEIEADLKELQKISDDDSSAIYIDELDTLVRQKISFNREILNTLYFTGKVAAENLIAQNTGKRLTDSIIALTHKIDSTRKIHLGQATASIDKGGKKAKTFSTILIAMVLICAAGLFWYIINIIKKQIFLIGQLKKSEIRVKESAKVKENFMANMSHEIRTPMNAILGFTNLLQRKNLDEESKEYIQTIQKSGENLLTIINDILDLSKIEAGMIRIEAAPFSIRGLLHSIEIMLKPKAAEKGLQLSVTVDKSVPDHLEGDSVRLTQILVNLIGNALKFTNKGSVLISITNEGVSGDVINTGITVSDTGIGIEKNKLQHIFNRFQQAEDSVTRKYGGTGLGLSIVKDLVLLQNGTIDVDSEINKGTTFRLMIPYKISTRDFVNIQDGDSSIIAPINFEEHFVLAAEDNEINQSLIKHLFKSWGLKYDLAKNGIEALEKLRRTRYDLILMDIQMPEMDGYTAAQEIRNSLKLNTPIIAMTAHALAGEREKCLSFGMNEYISKPIREEQLHELIARFTSLNTLVSKQKVKEVNPDAKEYKYINLEYMKEVSGGNREYEKTVTEQFIEAIPADLLQLQETWQDKHINEMQQLAHNMKTTISVMGLNETLQPCLDALEFETLTDESFKTRFSSLKSICEASVEEAKEFYTTL